MAAGKSGVIWLMLLLGLDIDTSSVKVSVVNAAIDKALATAQYPDTERGVKAIQPGWADIWRDSRAVPYGDNALKSIGEEKCLSYLLNSPGNFTASKLAWVKQNEPGIYDKIDKIMLPGDFIAMKLTGEITTNISTLSGGVFRDFKNNSFSKTTA